MAYEVLVGEIGLIAWLFFIVWVYHTRVLKNKLIQEADKLKARMANFRREFPEIVESPQEIVSPALTNMGLEGLIESLGLPAIATPIIKGFAQSVLSDPEKMKALSGKLAEMGVKLPATATQTPALQANNQSQV